jgi:DNA-binding SARP family transcriptional activator/tetratricopeptide (TPR) repeat protein
MRFGILGPVLVHDGEATLTVPAPRQRILLAALLLHAGQAVAAETLADVIWDGSPPAGATATLRTHVMRLRRLLGPQAGPRLVTRQPGYLLDASEDEVDMLQFSRLSREGVAAARAGSWGEAAGNLTEALRLWRGPALADVPAQLLQRDEAPRLEELRLHAQEWRFEAELHLGGHADLIPELQSLAARHPLRERLHAQLMLALYRGGRPAEALVAYRCARDALVEELGTEPGRELRELHRRILAADPALAAPSPAIRPGTGTPAVVPRQLPTPVRHFAGRDTELAILTDMLDPAAQQAPGPVVISAIGGTAGVGKTALAVHWAHQAARRFPDGQLYVNLRGYDPGQPVPAADALAAFLRSLGVPGQDIPPGEDERAARYRSLLAGKQMLIVLDNAGSAGQVRPLLPGTPACIVLVTSRDALAGLVARDGATRLDLDVLPPQESVALLRTLIGSRVDADPAAAAELAARCARLPLALRVAAELAVTRPAASLTDLARELADGQRGLSLLDAGGDPGTAVRAVFSWSYRNLDGAAARAFRLIGLNPGPDLDVYAVAALTGTALGRAGELVGQLTQASLIRGQADRYDMHDLLRRYARELAAAEDGEAAGQAALTRLFDALLYAAAQAMDTVFPAEASRRPQIPRPATPVPLLTDPVAARAWLDAQRPGFAAVARHCANHGWSGHVTRLAAILFRYLQFGGYYQEALALHGHASRTARSCGDLTAEAVALTNLGATSQREGRRAEAAAQLERAAALADQAHSPAVQARALSTLGNIDLRQGRYQQARHRHEQALSLHRQAGSESGQGAALINLGIVEMLEGRYQQAVDRYEQALALARQTGNQYNEAQALANLGDSCLRTGRYQQACEHFSTARALYRGMGDKSGEAHTATSLGDIDRRQGRYQQATEKLQEALATFREIADRSGEAEALGGLGEVMYATGQPDQAISLLTAALDLATQIGELDQQARTSQGLGAACRAKGDTAAAHRHLRQAIAIYASLNSPEADHLRAELDQLAATDASADRR